MLKQQKAEDDILKAYGSIIAVSVLLLLLATLGFRYFNSVPSIAGNSLAMEHNRLLHVIAMVRSQWLSSGRPHSITLNWDKMVSNLRQSAGQQQIDANGDDVAALPTSTQNIIQLSAQGFPQLASNDVNGCYQWWHQLLASSTDELQVSYDEARAVCHFRAENKASISYQHTSGRVIFVEAETKL